MSLFIIGMIFFVVGTFVAFPASMKLMNCMGEPEVGGMTQAETIKALRFETVGHILIGIGLMTLLLSTYGPKLFGAA